MAQQHKKYCHDKVYLLRDMVTLQHAGLLQLQLLNGSQNDVPQWRCSLIPDMGAGVIH